MKQTVFMSLAVAWLVQKYTATGLDINGWNTGGNKIVGSEL